jgi:hypothetical protein
VRQGPDSFAGGDKGTKKGPQILQILQILQPIRP